MTKRELIECIKDADDDAVVYLYDYEDDLWTGSLKATPHKVVISTRGIVREESTAKWCEHIDGEEFDWAKLHDAILIS